MGKPRDTASPDAATAEGLRFLALVEDVVRRWRQLQRALDAGGYSGGANQRREAEAATDAAEEEFQRAMEALSAAYTRRA